MLIEVTKCKNCEREWVTPLFDKPKDGLCGVCHEFDTRHSLKLPSGGDLAPLFDRESIKTISDAVNVL